MLFHVSTKAHDAVFLDDDKRVREAVGPHLQRMMQSGKVREAGIFSATRGEASSSSTSTRPKSSSSCSGPRSTPTSSWRGTPLRPWRR